MELSKDSPHIWDSYYARTAVLPQSEITVQFLEKIPQEGRLLDFGAGSGRWSAVFLTDRPDLTIDALDQNIDHATLLPEIWAGEKVKSSFQTFELTRSYDGIFAFATLFFVNKTELGECFHKLAIALKEGGTIFFTMVDDCHEANAFKFHGLSKLGILDMLEKEGLSLASLELNEQTRYGSNKMIVPTYTVTASKAAR